MRNDESEETFFFFFFFKKYSLIFIRDELSFVPRPWVKCAINLKKYWITSRVDSIFHVSYRSIPQEVIALNEGMKVRSSIPVFKYEDVPLFIRNISLYMKYQLDIRENNLNNFWNSSMNSFFYDTHRIIISNAIRFKIDASIVGCNCDRTMDGKLFFFFFKKKIKVTLTCNCREIDANYPL